MIVINHTRGEFGNTVSCGLHLPYMYHKMGYPIKVINRIWFPKEVTDQWYNEYECVKRNPKGEELHAKRNIESALIHRPDLANHPEAISSMPLPEFPAPTEDSYIVLVPTVYAHLGQTFHLRTVTSMTFREWTDIANTARIFGLKVAAFAAFDSITKEQIEELSDFSFYAEKKDIVPINRFYYDKQLPWMQNAKCNLSTGGACHTIMAFDFPGVIYDGQIHVNYAMWFHTLMKKRGNLDVLPRENHAIWPADGYRYQQDMEARDRMQRYWGDCFKAFMVKQLCQQGFTPQVDNIDKAMDLIVPRRQVLDTLCYHCGRASKALCGHREGKGGSIAHQCLQHLDKARLDMDELVMKLFALRHLRDRFPEAFIRESGLEPDFNKIVDALQSVVDSPCILGPEKEILQDLMLLVKKAGCAPKKASIDEMKSVSDSCYKLAVEIIYDSKRAR